MGCGTQIRSQAKWGGETFLHLGQLHVDVLSPNPATHWRQTLLITDRLATTPAAAPIFPARQTAIPVGNFFAPARPTDTPASLTTVPPNAHATGSQVKSLVVPP